MQTYNYEKLAAVLNKTEVMVLDFNQRCSLSQWWGQALIDRVRHTDFKPEPLQSTTIIRLLLHLSRTRAAL
jgi:predicted DCC family thiol-disulfide oxidoreductase YuxK